MLQPAANGLTNGERSYVLYCSDTCVACSDGLLALNQAQCGRLAMCDFPKSDRKQWTRLSLSC